MNFAFLARWYRLHFAPALRISTIILLVAVAVDVAALHWWGQNLLHPFAADIVSALLTLVILVVWSVRHSQELVKLDAHHRAIETAMGLEEEQAQQLENSGEAVAFPVRH
jgi:hypothetical protein